MGLTPWTDQDSQNCICAYDAQTNKIAVASPCIALVCNVCCTVKIKSVKDGSQPANWTEWTELTCNKLTQLHDAVLVTRVSVTKLIGCSSRTGGEFSSVWRLWTRLYSGGPPYDTGSVRHYLDGLPRSRDRWQPRAAVRFHCSPSPQDKSVPSPLFYAINQWR